MFPIPDSQCNFIGNRLYVFQNFVLDTRRAASTPLEIRRVLQFQSLVQVLRQRLARSYLKQRHPHRQTPHSTLQVEEQFDARITKIVPKLCL